MIYFPLFDYLNNLLYSYTVHYIILIYYLDKKFNKYIGNNMPRCNTEEELLKIIDEIKKEKDGATSTKDN